MKFFDRYKISLHNIKNNKSRSILTTVIVYIISLLIMTILCIGISFSNNMTTVVKEYYQVSDEPLYVSYSLYGKSPDGRVFDKNVYEDVDKVVNNHSSLISYALYSNQYSSSTSVGDHRFAMNDYYEIIEGDNVSALDSKTNAVLVSTKYANEYYNQTGTKLNPGDEINYKFKYNVMVEAEEGNGYYHNEQTNDLSLKVKGIFKIKEVESLGAGSIPVHDSTDVIVDVGYIFENVDDFSVESAYFYHTVTKTNFNNNELKDKLDSLVSGLNEVVPKSEHGKSVYCNALEDLKMTGIIGIVVIGLAAFLCLVLILLSIGSLANTIMISVDKNKKFIGLLKALGLDEKDLKSTIKLESITTIILGILLSFLTVFAFSGVLSDLNTLIINSLFSNYVKEVDYVAVFSLPLYIPVIVLFFFVAFTLLFARGSMSKIAKTDPMAVISEVA